MLDPLGYIMSWNMGAEDIYKYTSEDIIGKYFSILSTPEEEQQKKPQNI